MGSRRTYQQIIKTLFNEHAAYRSQGDPMIASQVVFDDEHGRYLVLDVGWDGDKYWHTTPIHVDVIDHQIWVQYDETEEGIATELAAAGVPKEDIVLGFHSPDVRPYTDFGVGKAVMNVAPADAPAARLSQAA